MSFEMEPEKFERVTVDCSVPLSKHERFAFIITNRALYIYEKRLFAVSDLYRVRKVPISEVTKVTLADVPPYASLLLAAGMMIVGGIGVFLVVRAFLSGEETSSDAFGYSLALLVVGSLIPFFTKSRYSLEVRHSGGSSRWKQPILFGASAAKRNCQKALQDVLVACRELGIHVLDKTSKRPHDKKLDARTMAEEAAMVFLTRNTERRQLKAGDPIRVIGGYNMDPSFLGEKESYPGRVLSFIPGQNERPAVAVELDEPVQVGNASGKFVVLQLRYSEASWIGGESVYVELCDFVPENKPWQERRTGPIVEWRAAFEFAP